MNEIERLGALKGSDIREAKKNLAYHATLITHGKAAAEEARAAAAAVFGAARAEADLDAVPTTIVPVSRLAVGVSPVDLFAEVGLTRSKSEARRLVQQGGMYVNNQRIEDLEQVLTDADVTPDGILLRAGKKKYHRVLAE